MDLGLTGITTIRWVARFPDGRAAEEHAEVLVEMGQQVTVGRLDGSGLLLGAEDLLLVGGGSVCSLIEGQRHRSTVIEKIDGNTFVSAAVG